VKQLNFSLTEGKGSRGLREAARDNTCTGETSMRTSGADLSHAACDGAGQRAGGLSDAADSGSSWPYAAGGPTDVLGRWWPNISRAT